MSFIQSHLGEFAALFTAIFWTVTALAFESAVIKIGSIPVNIIRLTLGFLFLSVFTLVSRGMFLPLDAKTGNWIWLSLSGFVGLVFGDLFLFKSYEIIGSRFSMLIMTLVPPITALSGFIILSEKLKLLHLVGMIVTFSGIMLAIFHRNTNGSGLRLKLAPKGILFAFGGAIGQALGLVLSKLGMSNYDPFASTQIRLISGIAGYILLITVLSRWDSVISAFSNRKGLRATSVGAFFGPFLGISFSLLAVKFTATGIASTIMALVPVFIIFPSVLLYKQKVTAYEIAGAVISVAGVALFFI